MQFTGPVDSPTPGVPQAEADTCVASGDKSLLASSRPRRSEGYGKVRRDGAFCFVVLFLVFAPVPRASALDLISDSESITAVSAKVFNNYTRQKQPDGAFRPEHYAFGNGGFVITRLGALDDAHKPTTMRDDTIDDMNFAAVGRIIEAPLASQGFLPTRDPEATKLLIMVFWGLTQGGDNYAGPDRDKVNQINASLLGYDSEIIFSEVNGLVPRANLMREIHADVLSSIQPNRYWVVLRAFDFQAAWKFKKLNLLWETRFSLSQRRHDFGKDLPAMTTVAAHFFGQDTHGLVNQPLPEGHVDVGEIKSLGAIQKSDSPASKP
jgi:hypothetical protein